MRSKRHLSSLPKPVTVGNEEKIPKKTKAFLGKVPNSSESLVLVLLESALSLSMHFFLYCSQKFVSFFYLTLIWTVIGSQCRKMMLEAAMNS